MKGYKLTLAALVAPLVLAGCMLPQPDTPIVPPPGAQAATAPGDKTIAPEAPAVTPAPNDALFTGTVTGLKASAVLVTPEAGNGSPVRQEIGADGAFELTLLPGVYRLQVVVGERVAVLAETITVQAGETRHVVLKLTDNPLRVSLEAAPEAAASSAAQ